MKFLFSKLSTRLNTLILNCILLIIFAPLYSQKDLIKGTILGDKRTKDSVIFTSGMISKSYYEKENFISEISNNKFNLKEKFSYPQMFYLAWTSERNKFPFRGGEYFLDESTKEIKIDYNYTESQVLGKSAIEYKNKFIPAILNNQNLLLDTFIYNSGKEFDSKLKEYISENSNSYVGLWFLIKRLNENGYSSLYEQILNSFSQKIKSEKLWNILNDEFAKIRIKENTPFPKIVLQNTDFTIDTLAIPKAKFTLIDFWFSRCRPCLEQIPVWKKIYNSYNSKGFNVIAISTDQTKDLEKWRKRIIEKEIPWKNYLDENAKEATLEKIFSFPTNFLLDSNGNVIRKNIEPEELEKLLLEKIK